MVICTDPNHASRSYDRQFATPRVVRCAKVSITDHRSPYNTAQEAFPILKIEVINESAAWMPGGDPLKLTALSELPKRAQRQMSSHRGPNLVTSRNWVIDDDATIVWSQEQSGP